MATPAKIKIEYFDTAMDLEIYYSFTQSNPTKENCEKLVKNNPKVLYINNGKKNFEGNFAFLCF
jgi:hypothetical protein